MATSLTPKLKPDWMSGARGGKTLMESLGGGLSPASCSCRPPASSQLPEIDELKELEPDATEDDGEECSSCLPQPHDAPARHAVHLHQSRCCGRRGRLVDEREYWLPLDKHQTVADLKKFMVQADALNAMGSSFYRRRRR